MGKDKLSGVGLVDSMLILKGLEEKGGEIKIGIVSCRDLNGC